MALCFVWRTPHAFYHPLFALLQPLWLSILLVLRDDIGNGLCAERLPPGFFGPCHCDMDSARQSIRLWFTSKRAPLANLHTAKERLASIYRLYDFQQRNLLWG